MNDGRHRASSRRKQEPEQGTLPIARSGRPPLPNEFVGQHQLRDNICAFLYRSGEERAARRSKTISCSFGPPGLGKTTLGPQIVAPRDGASIFHANRRAR